MVLVELTLLKIDLWEWNQEARLMFSLMNSWICQVIQTLLGIYETPGHTILFQAHYDIETFTMDRVIDFYLFQKYCLKH